MDNFLQFPIKHVVVTQKCASNESQQHIFYVEIGKKNYPIIITKYLSLQVILMYVATQLFFIYFQEMQRLLGTTIQVDLESLYKCALMILAK